MDLRLKQQTLISDLNLIADPHERLSVIVNRSTGVDLPERHKIDANRVPGCTSRVWLIGTLADGRCHFQSDADSPVVKGLVALLCDLYTGASPKEVSCLEPELWAECGLDRLLSPTRMNGLKSVRARIRELALQMQTSPPAAG
jgi:cysteine desulfuration protein SufE